MSEPIKITSFEQLKPFLNDNNVIEIVTRGKKKKFKKFFNLMLDSDSINDVSKNTRLLKDQQALMQNVIQAVGKNTSMAQKSVEVMGKVAKLQGIGLVLNGLNLGATAAGFLIMDKRLKQMSEQIDEKMNQLQNIIKTGNTIETERHFNEACRKHSNMLDRRRRQKPFEEEKTLEVIDKEYNVLNTLISIFREDISSDKHTVFTMIFSLLGMFTATLKYFDENYYFENREILKGKDILHISHDAWMHVYDILSADWMIEYIQDYAIFELKLNPREADIYYKEMMSIVIDGKREIEDNLFLLETLNDMNLMKAFNEYTNESVCEEMDKLLDQVFNEFGGSEFKIDFTDIIDQVTAVA